MDKLSLLLFALCLHCVVSDSEFFRFYGPNYRDTNFTQSTTNEATLALHADLRLSCGIAKTLTVYASGRVLLTGASNEQLMVLNVFGVDAGEIDARVVNYRYLRTDQEVKEIVDCMITFYTRYFPRENLTAPFEPATILVVTWQIVQDIMSSTNTVMNNNTFQMAIATQGNRSLIALFYEKIEWDASTAIVSVETCGTASWTPPGTRPAGETVVDSSNLASGRRGEWVLYVPNSGVVTPAVVCRSGCSLTNGYCTEPGTCLCRTNWSGNNCDVPVCPSGCVQGQGSCNAPDVCTCNPGWTGTSCDTALCHYDCINGGCNTPYNCTCRNGWVGQNCTNAVCAQDCGCFGFCTRPNHCSCIKGYGGDTCEPICASDTCEGGCLNGGNCTAPETCVCATGWTGACCNVTVVMSPTPTPTGTDPTVGSTDPSSSLSGSTIGAIAGSIAALVVIVVVVAVIFIIALISC